MSNQHIRAWQALLQRLSCLTDCSKGLAEDRQQFALAAAALSDIHGLPAPMPRAVLRSFVQEAEVGTQLQTQALF